MEFDINTPYSFYSNNKNYTVNIDDYLLPADYKYYCVPKIDKDVFLIAYITDWEKYNLLDGEANIFFENTYVGKSLLDTKNYTDTLNISLGRDKSVMVKREKTKGYSSKQFLSNKKEETRAWSITVKNNKPQKIKMQLFDQVPVSSNSEIEVSVDNKSNGILNAETGEINWNFELEPAANKEFDFIYNVKFPKNKNLFIE